MDTKTLELRPDWTESQYPTGHKIDLSNNVCFDAAQSRSSVQNKVLA